MYLKNLSTHFVLTVILFTTMVYNHKSVARTQRSKHLRKFLKFDDKTISWLKYKRMLTYNNPCKTQENIVNASSLVLGSNVSDNCPNCEYFPSKFKEVKCDRSNPLSLNVRGKVSCGHKIFSPSGSSADCCDIDTMITVTKVYPDYQYQTEHNVTVKVGCACKLLV